MLEILSRSSYPMNLSLVSEELPLVCSTSYFLMNCWHVFLTLMRHCSTLWLNLFYFILLLERINTSAFMCSFSNSWDILSLPIFLEGIFVCVVLTCRSHCSVFGADQVHTSDGLLQSSLSSRKRSEATSFRKTKGLRLCSNQPKQTGSKHSRL